MEKNQFEKDLDQLENDLNLQLKKIYKQLRAIETLRLPYVEAPKIKVRKPREDSNPNGPTAVIRRMFQEHLNVRLPLSAIETYLKDQIKKKECLTKTQCVKSLAYITVVNLVTQGFLKQIKIGTINKYVHDSDAHRQYQKFL